MKFPKTCKIHKAAAKENAGRYSYDQVLLHRTKKGADDQLVACDGRMLAIIPVTDSEDDEPGLIPASAIVEAVKGSMMTEAHVVSNGNVRVTTKTGVAEFEHCETSLEFPKWQQVMPKGKYEHRIALNPKLLLAAAEAIGANDSIVIEIRDPKGPLVIRPTGAQDDGRVAVVMPLSLDAVVPPEPKAKSTAPPADTRPIGKRTRKPKVAKPEPPPLSKDEIERYGAKTWSVLTPGQKAAVTRSRNA